MDEEYRDAVAAPPPPHTTPKPQRVYRESERTADEETPVAAPLPTTTKPQKAYALTYFQDRIKARVRKEALLDLVAATGR